MTQTNIDVLFAPALPGHLKDRIRDTFIPGHGPRQIQLAQGDHDVLIDWQGEWIITHTIVGTHDIEKEVARLIRQAKEECAKLVIYTEVQAAKDAFARRLSVAEATHLFIADVGFARIIAK